MKRSVNAFVFAIVAATFTASAGYAKEKSVTISGETGVFNQSELKKADLSAAKAKRSKKTKRKLVLVAERTESAMTTDADRYDSSEDPEEANNDASSSSRMSSKFETSTSRKRARPDEPGNVSIRIFPLTMLLMSFSADINFAVTRTFSAGPTATYMDFGLAGVNVRSRMFGGRLAWYKDGVVQDSLYLASTIMHGSSCVWAEADSSRIDANITSTTIDPMIGYQWRTGLLTWSIAGGARLASTKITESYYESSGTQIEIPSNLGESKPLPFAEFALGLVF